MSFKKWCSENQGIFAFLALIVAFIPVLFSIGNIPLSLKNGILSLLSIFLIKINIPIYIVVLFGVIFFFFAYKYLLKQNIKNVVSKNEYSQSNLDVIIQSDSDTLFIESPTYKYLQKNIKSLEYNHPSWLKHSNQFLILKGAKWISHSINITDDEAIDGGLYIFKKDFQLDDNTKKIKNANLYLLVDDFCTVYLNGKILITENGLTRVEGFKELKSYDISTYLIKGINEILFYVENVDFHRVNVPGKSFYNAQNKGQHNPYGLIYSIKIQ